MLGTDRLERGGHARASLLPAVCLLHCVDAEPCRTVAEPWVSACSSQHSSASTFAWTLLSLANGK